ncbi:hypothetical protein ACMFMG_004548 [Clarireedia jacksonii]
MATPVAPQHQDALLQLLQALNEKLSRDAAANKETTPLNSAPQRPPWKWYEHLASPEELAVILQGSSTPPQRPQGLAASLTHGSTTQGMKPLSRHASKIQSTWRDLYEPCHIADQDVLQDLLEDQLGAALDIPFDNRWRLAFTLATIGNPQRIQHIKSFHESLDGMDVGISVVDYNPWGGRVTYELHMPKETDIARKERWREIQIRPFQADFGETWTPFRSIDPSLRPIHNISSIAMSPWRRLISFEGLANSKRVPSLTPNLLCPYFGEFEEISSAFEFHLKCLMVPGTTANNPYALANCFNITFYEIVSSNSRHESHWKTGPLFTDGVILNDSDSGERLRHSAFTVDTKSTSHDPLEPFYTVVLLTPETFHMDDKSSCLFEVTAIESELWCIKSGLLNVVNKWMQLSRYFGDLLADDFLNLKEYVKLLFDDENFTRSRKYFWAIGCLTEFTNVLSDNIKQWDLYYEARIRVLLELENIEERLAAASLYPPYAGEGELRLRNFRKSIRECQNHRESLVGLREDFQRKLDSANALRDGLFNASALVESRASTRLGENVKLLTYVSIFYLPLAFCAAIWAIPDIQSSSVNMPFIIMTVIVGVMTYAVALNMDFLNRKLGAFYYPRRQSLINQMQMEVGRWKATGEKFEQFKPTSEDKVPTEWWIPLYWVRTIFINVFGKWRSSTAQNDEPPETVTPTLNHISSLTIDGHSQPRVNGPRATSHRFTSLKTLGTVALNQVSSYEPLSLRSRILERLGRGQGGRGVNV